MEFNLLSYVLGILTGAVVMKIIDKIVAAIIGAFK